MKTPLQTGRYSGGRSLSFSAFSEDDLLEVSPIKLPARHSDFLVDFIELDVDGDGFTELLELTQDETGFAIQLINQVDGDKLLLGTPILPVWNESFSAFSIGQSPKPVLAILGYSEVSAEHEKVRTGIGLASTAERIIQKVTNYVDTFINGMEL